MPKHKSEDYKKTAVEYYLFENPNQIKTCKIFKCSERSLMRWVEKYKKTGNIKRKKKHYIAYKVKEKYVKFIKEVIKKDKTITMKDLLEELRKKYPSVNITQMHLSRIVRDNNISLKQLRLRYEPKTWFKKPVNIKEQLKKFYEEIKIKKQKKGGNGISPLPRSPANWTVVSPKWSYQYYQRLVPWFIVI